MYTFPSKQLELLQNNYWCLNIHSVQNHLSESLWFAFSYRSACIYEENTSKYWWPFFFNSSRFWHLPGTDISLRSYHHCPDHYHTSYAVVTRKRKGRPILCSCPENSELLVHSDWGRPFEPISTQADTWFGKQLTSKPWGYGTLSKTKILEIF